MAPSKIELGLWHRLLSRLANLKERTRTHSFSADPIGSEVSESADVQIGWRHVAKRRRIALALVALGQTALASWSLGRTFSNRELNALQVAIIVNYSPLFAWISFSF